MSPIILNSFSTLRGRPSITGNCLRRHSGIFHDFAHVPSPPIHPFQLELSDDAATSLRTVTDSLVQFAQLQRFLIVRNTPVVHNFLARLLVSRVLGRKQLHLDRLVSSSSESDRTSTSESSVLLCIHLQVRTPPCEAQREATSDASTPATTSA